MSIEIMAEVWKHAPCRGGELLFVLALADQAGDEDRCAWPGMKMLMDRTRSSRRSVYNYADTLQRQQVIEQIAPEEAPKRWRPSRHGGHETTLWRIRPVDEWLDENGVLLIHSSTGAEVAPQKTSTSTGRGATSAQVGCNPLHQNQQEPPTRKNNYPTTSGSRSSRRASARRGDDDGWADPSRAMFDKADEQEDDGEGVNPRGGPDSAWGLNKHYRDSVRVAGNGFLGNTNDKAMRGFFAAAKRQGIKPDVLRAMVDEFVSDERLFTKATGGARWRVFIANAEGLRQRVAVARSVGRVADFSKVPEFGGSIPQHILDEILAEVG